MAHHRQAFIFCIITAINVATSATQAQELVPIKTKSGCEIRVDKAIANPVSQVFQYLLEWRGACVGGMGQGLGELEMRIVGNNFDSTTFILQTLNAGIPFGYTKGRWLKPPEMANATQMNGTSFVFDGLAISFTKGWGLSQDGLVPGGQAMSLPQTTPVEVFEGMAINDGKRRVVLVPSACLLQKDRLSACHSESAADRTVFTVMEMLTQGDPIANHRNRKVVFCADPFSIASCTPLIEQMGAPLRLEILAVLQRAKPQVDALLQRTNGAPTIAATRPNNTVQTVTPSQTVNLEALSVGSLFALADEAAAKGDKVGARAALRTLIRRFPDHSLAEPAARQLTALQTP